MQYCTKCKNICQDTLTVCPQCRRSRSLRSAKEGDSVYLQKATEFEAGELSGIFDSNGIRYEVVPYSTGIVSSIYDSEVMPTDKNVFVNFEDLDRAKELIESFYAENEEEDKDGEEFDPMTRKKRILVQIVSVIAFLVVVSLVVFGADAAANGIKDLFTNLFK